MSKRGLYIHVPFCRKKCPYCDFYSVGYSREQAEKYADAVVRNLGFYDEAFDTVYFGGGTPILLYEEIPRILSVCKSSENAEITVECNPLEMDRKTLEALRFAGVNRLSVGVQSLNDGELAALGRSHDSEQAKRAILLAREVGFSDISADLMLAIPGQGRDSLSKTIEQLCGLPITHVSAYLLKIEPNTLFGKNPPILPDEDETAALYLQAVGELSERGFLQYEISSFAKNDAKSRHNLKYWRREEYLGIGPAAHSFYNGKRFAVGRNLREFIESPRQNEVITDDFPNALEEEIMLGLRLSEGIPKRLWEQVYGGLASIPKKYYRLDDERLSLTPEGFLVSNEIISVLLGKLEQEHL